MFPVVLNDGQTEMPDTDIFYVIAKEGIFLKKKLGIMESLAPVENISTLKSISATATMHISKIPGPQFAKVIEFFREVYKLYHGEAIVLLFYNEETKKHKIFPPHQKVTAGSCDYNRGVTVEGYTMIGTIHSHGGMSAFHSGTDDKDEESFDGLHITIGNVRDEEVSISASIVANGYRVMVDPKDYIEKLELTKDIDETQQAATTKIYKWKDGKLVEDTQRTKRYTYTYRKFDKRYVSTVTESQKRFNKKWLKAVERGVYVYRRPVGFPGYRGYSYGGWGDWGPGFDSSLWDEKPGSIVVRGKPDPRNVGPYKTAGVSFPPHTNDDNDDDLNPCHDCIYRDHKLDWALEQFTDEAEDEPDEEDLIDNFTSREDYDKLFMEGNITCHSCFEVYHGPSYEKCPTCGAPNLSDSIAAPDPILGKEFKCPTCGNDFTYNGVDECPFCKQELDFTDYRQEAIKRGDVKPSKQYDNLVPNQWYLCNNCTTIFEAHGTQGTCPNCKDFMIDGYNCTPYNVEAEKEARHKKDSGEMASKSDILQKAAEADRNLERIPDPDKPEIPLSSRVQRTSKMSIKEMFRKTFGRESKK